MATKKDLAAKAEKLVERIAVAHGATIVQEEITVGGRATKTNVAKDGLFDLDACRGLLMRALDAYAEKLVSHFGATQPAAVSAAYELQPPAQSPSPVS